MSCFGFDLGCGLYKRWLAVGFVTRQRWLSILLLVVAFSASSAALAEPSARSGIPDEIAELSAAERQQLRIVALAPHIVELLYQIGAGDQIVATTEYADYPPEAIEIPRAGSYAGLQIEKILALKPDLVIAWKTGNPESDLLRLQQLGVKLVYSDIAQLEDLPDELRWYGRLTGRSEEAARYGHEYHQRLQQLKTRYSGKAPVSVFYELWSRPLTTVAGSAWPQQQLALCGGDNPFSDLPQDYPQVSLEKVLQFDPELIIQPDHNGKRNHDAITWSDWPSLRAVKQGQILQQNADHTHRMTLRVLDAIEELCESIDSVRG